MPNPTERARTAVGHFIHSAASDEPPRVIRSWRVWGYPGRYCATVVLVGALSLLIRPFWRNATGSTYGGERVHNWANCWGLAFALALPLVIAVYIPKGGAFFFVLWTALVRGQDSLRPLSVVPFALYLVLVPAQLCVWLDINPVVVAARWWETHHHA